jgi:hypothetical protein
VLILVPAHNSDLPGGSPATIPYLTVVSLVTIWAVARGFRVAMIADTYRFQVRNPFRTYNLWWEDVAQLREGSVGIGGFAQWAIAVRARNGRAFMIYATATRFATPDFHSVVRLAVDRNVPISLTGREPEVTKLSNGELALSLLFGVAVAGLLTSLVILMHNSAHHRRVSGALIGMAVSGAALVALTAIRPRRSRHT